MISQVWLVDDASAAGRLKPLVRRCEELELEGGQAGYYVNQKKCLLVVNSTELEARLVQKYLVLQYNTANITTEGKRQLGACIGSGKYKKEYWEGIVEKIEDRARMFM